MWIKICANTNAEDALLAAKMGADAVGFVLAPSKRRVTCEEVAEITAKLSPGVQRVGVFATNDCLEIATAVHCGGLTAVQLHGTFTAPLVQELAAECPGVKIIQTLAYELQPADRADADARFEAALRLVFAEPNVWAVLLDAAKGGVSGGLGMAFAWAHVATMVRRTTNAFGHASPHVILAGGLRSDNVTEAITAMQPWGVDVASGVESAPGMKDAEKMRRFIEQARNGPSLPG